MTEHINSVDIDESIPCEMTEVDESNPSEMMEETRKTFEDRLEDMPAYRIILRNLKTIYAALKDKNEYVKNAINTGESFAGSFISAAKPVVLVATDAALKIAEPVVGEIKDPAASIDGYASEVLGKIQERLPLVKQTPGEIVEAAKSSAEETAKYYYDKVQGFAVTQNAVKQLDNAVSFSDLMVEVCFPSDSSNPDDMGEIEQDEQDENKGLLVHAGNVKRKAYRRGTRKIMANKTVTTTIDMMHYAQSKISETTGMFLRGSDYVITHSTGSVSSNITEVKATVQDEITEGRNLFSENLNVIYKSGMLIPISTLQLAGKYFVSAKDMILSYSNDYPIMEIPRHILNVAESYYSSIKQSRMVGDIKDTAVAFVYIPAQVVQNYIQSNQIVPNHLETDTIQVKKNVNEDTE